MDAGSSNTVRYVSGALAEWSDLTQSECSLPSIERLEGAFLFVDISGFTSVASRMSQEGGEGVERISDILTEFFGQLVSLVEREGGVVFGFEGDALMAGWRCDAADPSWVLRQCCDCALEIQWKFGGWNANGQNLKLRMSLGAGEIELVHLGTPTHRCYFLPAGDAVEQAIALVPSANPSEILISHEAWLSIQDTCDADVQKNGAVRLLRFKEPHHRDPHVRRRTAPSGKIDCYLPQALRARLHSALPNWVGELRYVAIAFIKVLFAGRTIPLSHLNEILLTVERNVEGFGGEILEVSTSKEGLETLCVFGFPAGRLKDIGQHAILATIQVRDEFDDDGFSVSAGIATGQVFCGPVGPEHRRQYSVVGAPVYLAARMLSVAAGRVLVDEETMASTSRRVSFDGPYPLHLAGIRDSVKCFIPSGPVGGSLTHPTTELIDREAELNALNNYFAEAANVTKVVLITGEAGIGKTALTSTFADLCKAQILQSTADAVDRVTPYLAWRSIINRCLELDLVGSNANRKKEAIQRQLKKNRDLIELAPLLNDVLDLELDENWLTSNMPRDVRAEKLERLLSWVVEQRLETEQSVIILEDAQWMDEGSWRLLIDLIRLDLNALFIISCRNLYDVQTCWRSELQELGYHRIDLKRLSKADTIAFVRKRLNQTSISDQLAHMIVETTEGNPLFIDEICNLLNQGNISLEASATDGDYAIKLPRALEATVRSRIDNLPMDDQLVLKLASVIGTTFKLDALNSVAPKSLDVGKSIDTLLGQQLLKSLPGNIEQVSFRHQLIRDLVYDGLLSGQKRETHAALASFLEAESASSDAVRLPLVLHHWRCANNPKKVVGYLDQVAALRLRQFDNLTAIELLNECLSLARVQGIELEDDKKAGCHLLLGEAYVGNGLMAEGRKSYEEGLRLMGLALPGKTRNLFFGLLGEVLRQCWTRLTGPPSTVGSTPAIERKPSWDAFYMAAKAYENLVRIYYLGGEKTRVVHAVLKATNLAEALRECTPALAMNYAVLGAICGSIPLRRQAEYYLRRASETGKLYDDPRVSAEVNLPSGIYRTSIGDWEQAEANFVAGMDDARTIGDRRRWCELAICLEMISGPWLLTPAFSSIETWEKLIEELASVGRHREDSHAVGCAILASLRGNRTLGRASHSQDSAEVFKEFLCRENTELELIHKVEGCAHFAGMEFEKGELSEGNAWLQRSREFLTKLTPSMKVRTLPALSFLFDACLQQLAMMQKERLGSIEFDLVSRVVSMLTHFARVFPLGQPESLRCKGDLSAITGNRRKAVKFWRESLRRGTKFNMPLAAHYAAERLKRVLEDDDIVAIDTVPDFNKSFARHSDVRDVVEHAVANGAINCLPLSALRSRRRGV
jgi:class 3 adenylate cyclase